MPGETRPSAWSLEFHEPSPGIRDDLVLPARRALVPPTEHEPTASMQAARDDVSEDQLARLLPTLRPIPIRRGMYDPVRDSVASSPSPSHTVPSGRPPEDRKLQPPITAHASHSYILADKTRLLLHSDMLDGVRLARESPPRESSRHNDGSRIAGRASQLDSQVPAGPADGSAVGIPEYGSEQEVRASDTFGRDPCIPPSDVPVASGSKRSGDDYHHDIKVARESASVVDNYVADVEADGKRTKGKGKAIVALQSPAFRIDHLLDANPSSDDGRSLESRLAERAEYTFTGTLPPPPTTTAGSSTHTSMDHLGISVSKDVNLDQYAIPDEFEKALFASEGPYTNALRATLPGYSGPEQNLKRARKHGPSSQRRKARGLFPSDNVPLAISTSTSKQSRYRPSGDRQPVACGYKDPITQIQCDEPFNRSVELRRHVRAVHVPAEALAVTMGQLSRSQATLLPADWKPGDGDVLRPKCLCGKEFSRLDALRRHWTGVQAEVKDGKCISCPSSLGKKKDHAAFEQQGTEGTYGASVYS